MKFSLFKYLIFAEILASAFGFFVEPLFGLLNVIFTVVSLFCLNLLARNRPFYFKGGVLITFAFFIGYIIRGFILYANPIRFKYYWVSTIDSAMLNEGFVQVIIVFTIILIGYTLVTLISKPDNLANRSFNVNTNKLVNLGFWLSLFKLLLFLSTGAGLKGSLQISQFNFLLRLVPEDLIYLIFAYVILFGYSSLSQRKKIMLYMGIIVLSISILLTGSKAFLILFGLAVFISFVYLNRKIPLLQAGISLSLGTIIIVLSFIISFAVKRTFTSNADIVEVSKEVWNTSSSVDLLDDVTGRFIGIDGLIVADVVSSTNSGSTRKLSEVFGFGNTLLRSVEYVVPGVNLTSSVSSGVAIGYYIHNFENRDIAFGGAVGLIGAFILMDDSMIMFYSALTGIIFALLFRISTRQKNHLHSFLIYGIVSFLVLQVTISGNFDALIAKYFIKLIWIFAYARIFKLTK